MSTSARRTRYDTDVSTVSAPAHLSLRTTDDAATTSVDDPLLGARQNNGGHVTFEFEESAKDIEANLEVNFNGKSRCFFFHWSFRLLCWYSIERTLYERTQCMSFVLRRTTCIIVHQKPTCQISYMRIEQNWRPFNCSHFCEVSWKRTATQITMKDNRHVGVIVGCVIKTKLARTHFVARIRSNKYSKTVLFHAVGNIDWIRSYQLHVDVTPVCWPCYWQRHVGVS